MIFAIIEKILPVLFAGFVVYYSEVYRLLWEIDTAAAWLLRRLPTFLAVRFAVLVQAKRNHNDEPSCIACKAKARIQQAAHRRTTGPVSEYCSKCGLSMRDWPRYCANRVVQVNNRPQRKGTTWFKQLFWD